MPNTKSRIEQDIIESEEKENRKLEIRRFFIVFTGSIAIMSFIISLVFFIQMTVSGYVVGKVIAMDFINVEGNVYGLLIITIISLIWTVQMLIWFKKLIRKD
jgi:hypothetical protein